jgi:plastocyanin
MRLRKLSYCALTVLLLTVIACGGKKEEGTEGGPAPQPGAPAGGGNVYDASKSTASITGKVSFEGAKPNLAKLQMNADPVCMKAHTSPVFEQTVEVNDNGTLKDVFIYVKEGADKWTFTPPSDPVVLDQRGCLYHPHIIVVMAGQKLKILNSDPTTHNIHPAPKINTEWNLGQPPGVVHEKVFDKPEIMIPVKCDVHRWMKAFIAVTKNPFNSVSGDDGTFTIKNLPAGTYTIEAWHEKYGPQTQSVTVGDNEKKEVNFSFKGV